MKARAADMASASPLASACSMPARVWKPPTAITGMSSAWVKRRAKGRLKPSCGGRSRRARQDRWVSASPLRASAKPIPGRLPARVRIAVAHHLPNVQPPRRRSTRTTPPRIRRLVAGGCPHSAAVPKGPTSHNVLRRIPLPHQSSGGCALSTKPVRKCVPADLSGLGDTHYPHTSWQVENGRGHGCGH